LKHGRVKVTLIATGFNGTSSGSLFGGQFAERQSILGSFRSAVLEKTTPSPKAFTASAKGVSTALEPDLEMPPRVQREESDAKKKEKESDVWDIPTFLRKKKK